MSIASLVLGLVWLAGLGSVLAIIFGHLARGQVKRTGEQGGGLAIAGLVLGYVGAALAAILFISAAMQTSNHTSLLTPLGTNTRGYDAGVKSDLRTVANEMETYFTDNQIYPTSSQVSGVSGRIAIGTDEVALSQGDAVIIAQSGRNGFCLVGTNPLASQTWYYDSLRGGVTPLSCLNETGY
jgi:hypothetical protein